MAKGRAKKKAGKKKTAARRRKGAGLAARQAIGTKRARLHAAAALLKDFHGGKPMKPGHSSGCGRPRKRRAS